MISEGISGVANGRLKEKWVAAGGGAILANCFTGSPLTIHNSPFKINYFLSSSPT
jgi:hypothetical protein